MKGEGGFGRLMFFSDAVVAIAITLLILPLVDSAAHNGSRSVGHFLSANIYQILVFGLSFAVIARFWVVHHRMYESVVGYRQLMMIALFCWLLGIVFLPLPTELLAWASAHDQAANAFYVGTLLFTSAASLAQHWVIARSPELRADGVRGHIDITSSAIATGLVLVALMISVAVPVIGLWALTLLLLSQPLQVIVTKKSQLSRH